MITRGYSHRRLDANYLITLAVVAETLNLSDAAAELGISQPGVSQQLKQLSEAIGERLHNRSGHGISLTSGGKELARRSSDLLRAFRAVNVYVDNLIEGDSGVLSLAASNTISAHVLPAWLVEFRSLHRGVELLARSENSREVVASVLNHRSELGLIESPDEGLPSQLNEVLVGGDELVLVASPSLGLPRLAELSWDELVQVPLIWRERGSGVRRAAERALENAGMGFRVSVELAGGEAVKEAVISGLGAGFLSSLAVGREVDADRLKVVSIEGLGPIQRSFRLIYADRDSLSIPARNFVEYVSSLLEVRG